METGCICSVCLRKIGTLAPFVGSEPPGPRSIGSMTKPDKFTRRTFLETALVGPAVIGMAAEVRGDEALPQAAEVVPQSREFLRALMDEIIPARDGMPAASQVGGVEYLERVSRQDSQIGAELQHALDALARLSESRFHATFTSVSSAQRVEILTAFEAQSPEAFASLRDRVYESYYTQPSVWKLIGYEFHPTNESGPHMKPFDDSVLAGVRKMSKLYREVD
jgi:Gluconate 2-dehydrogenase subunit 3